MTLAQLIERARTELAAAIATRQTAQEALVALRSDPNLTVESVEAATASRDTADAEVTRRQEALDGLLAEEAREAEIAELTARTSASAPRPTGGARVTSEPEVYRQGGPVSYFRDLYRATQRGDRGSMERLERNDRQVLEQRALTTTDGAGGEFVPPLWMVNQFMDLARAGRVIADQVAQQALPGGTDTISLPRLVTGTAVAEQATQNSALQNTDATTGSVSAAVATLGGQQVVSLQLLEQSPVNLDDVLLQDLANDYAVKLDTFVISNNATNKVGLLNVSGAISVTYTDASPTLGELYPKIADAIQQVHTNRFMPPDKIFMHPRRWAAFLAAVDSQGRPLVVPNGTGQNQLGTTGGVISQGLVGTLQGLPVYVDPNIPTNLGTGTNEDRIIVLRSSDVILFEGTPRAEASRDQKFDQLSVVLRFYNYAALHASRYPKSVAIISGTGLVAPVFGA